MEELENSQKRWHLRKLLQDMSLSHSLGAGEMGREQSRERKACVKAEAYEGSGRHDFLGAGVSGVEPRGERVGAAGQPQIINETETIGTSYGQPKTLNVNM